MARLPYEGRTKIRWVPSIANMNAPTVAELNAGVDLTTFVTKDGVNPGLTNNRIDTAGIDSAFDAQIQGSWGAEFQLTCMRDDTNDTAWTTLQRGVQGFIVIGYNSPSGIIATHKVQVWAVEFGTPLMQPSAANTNQMFIADVAIALPPRLEATVA